MRKHVARLRSEFMTVQEMADITHSQILYCWLERSLQHGEISYAQLGTTPHGFEAVRDMLMHEEEEFLNMKVPDHIAQYAM